jgi:hypothetical protein
LWPIGPNDKHDNFANRHAWHWKSEHLELQASLLFDTIKLKTQEVGWHNQQWKISA